MKRPIPPTTQKRKEGMLLRHYLLYVAFLIMLALYFGYLGKHI